MSDNVHVVSQQDFQDPDLPQELKNLTIDDMATFAKQLEQKIDSEATPTASSYPPEVHAGEADQDDDSDEDSQDDDQSVAGSEGSDHNEKIHADIMSVTSDVNKNSEEITYLSEKVRGQESKVGLIPDLDSRLRSLTDKFTASEAERKDYAKKILSLEQTIQSQNTLLERLIQRVESQKADLTASQTHLSKAIADVERRAATKQLRSDVTPVDVSPEPPSSVRIDTTGDGKDDSASGSTASQAPSKKVTKPINFAASFF